MAHNVTTSKYINLKLEYRKIFKSTTVVTYLPHKYFFFGENEIKLIYEM